MAESNKMKDMPVNKLMIQMGIPMSMNLRADGTFVEDKGWHQAAQEPENSVYGTWCRLQHPRHYKISFLADDKCISAGILYMLKPERGIRTRRDSWQIHLHGY